MMVSFNCQFDTTLTHVGRQSQPLHEVGLRACVLAFILVNRCGRRTVGSIRSRNEAEHKQGRAFLSLTALD